MPDFMIGFVVGFIVAIVIFGVIMIYVQSEDSK